MSGTEPEVPYRDREVSKLSYLARLLQEASDLRVPPYDRVRLLAIWSAQLDEFYRIRVASLKSLARHQGASGPRPRVLRGWLRRLLGRPAPPPNPAIEPEALLEQIQEIVSPQQDEFGRIWARTQDELRELGIDLVREDELGEAQSRFVATWFAARLAPLLKPLLVDGEGLLELKNGVSYLAVQLRSASEGARLAVVEVPSPELPRFVSLPERDGRTQITYLDEVIRHRLSELFPADDVVAAHAVKLTRDANLHLEDEFSGDLLEQIRESLGRRDAGLPSRLLYDMSMPQRPLRRLQEALGVSDEDLVPGSRYHNMKDLASLPLLLPSRPGCSSAPLPPLGHPRFTGAGSIFEQICRGDAMLCFPYHDYEPVLRFVREAAHDADVEAITISLYRVAHDSQVVQSLVEAAQAGKAVFVFVEVKARFDEESNIYWAQRLEKAGARVLYRCPGLKVHSKLCLVERREAGQLARYTYLSTGNFNEATARSYCDLGVFTTDPAVGRDARRVFESLLDPASEPELETLVVAPFTIRQRLTELVDAEIRNARAGRPAKILIKVNNLEGPAFIAKLYEASAAGVKIRLIVRSICCLVPGLPGVSDNIDVISIVDRFLEHARIYVFHNGGDERFFVASADLMTRNLSQRVEVVLPVRDPDLCGLLSSLVELQWADTRKARALDAQQSNRYRGGRSDGKSSQEATYELLEKMSVSQG